MKTIAWCAQLSRKRSIWLTIIIICALLLTFAHLILQQWLYMSPCEQCVYIRFSLVVILLAAGIVCLFPKSLTIKSIGCLTGLTASYYGMRCSLLLQRIHDALRSDDINTLFGLDGCSMKPRFPLDLPLQDWFPTWFMPTGECGIDLPVVPSGAMLGGLQQHLIKTYESAGSWYLIPQLKWLTMAQCCELAFFISASLVITLWIAHALDYTKFTQLS